MADQQVSAAAQQLSQALEAMHQPGTSAENLAAANSYLDKFQQTDLAWKVFNIQSVHALTCFHDRCMQCMHWERIEPARALMTCMLYRSVKICCKAVTSHMLYCCMQLLQCVTRSENSYRHCRKTHGQGSGTP